MKKKTLPSKPNESGYLFQNKVVVEYTNILFTHLIQHPTIHQQVLSEIYKVINNIRNHNHFYYYQCIYFMQIINYDDKALATVTINLLSLMLGSSLRSISASPTRDSYRALARDCLHRVLNSEHSDPLALLGHILTSTVLTSFYNNNNNSFNTTLESLLNFCSFPNFHELIVLARLIESVDASSLTSSSPFLFSSTNLLNNEKDNILNNEKDNDNILRNENEFNDDDNKDDPKREFDLDALRDFLVARFKELYKKRMSDDSGNEDISLFKSRCRYDLFAEYLVQFVALDDELEPLLLDVLSLPSVLCLESQDLNRPSLFSCDDDEPLLHTGEVVCEMGPVSCCLSVENFKKSMFLSSSTGSIKTLSEDDVARVLNYIIL